MKYRSIHYLKYFALLGVLLLPLTYSQAQVSFGVGIGVGPGYVTAAPVCSYGYYPDYPYSCAPYGYYGPSWFSGGVFIGAGPWYRGYGHPTMVALSIAADTVVDTTVVDTTDAAQSQTADLITTKAT